LQVRLDLRPAGDDPWTGPRQVVDPPMSYCPAPDAGLGLRVGRIE
jgi:hypothetical protein